MIKREQKYHKEILKFVVVVASPSFFCDGVVVPGLVRLKQTQSTDGTNVGTG